MMGDVGSLTRAEHAALFLDFLQADCAGSLEFCKELLSLGKDYNHNHFGDLEDDGHLETDSPMSFNPTIALEGIEPFINAPRPEIIQQIAAEIREIAAELEQDVVTRATHNLSRNISESSKEHWREYLHLEVHNILARGVGLDNLQQERMIAVLTFTLVKGVCLRSPGLLRGLFDTALQYLSQDRGRYR